MNGYVLGNVAHGHSLGGDANKDICLVMPVLRGRSFGVYMSNAAARATTSFALTPLINRFSFGAPRMGLPADEWATAASNCLCTVAAHQAGEVTVSVAGTPAALRTADGRSLASQSPTRRRSVVAPVPNESWYRIDASASNCWR